MRPLLLSLTCERSASLHYTARGPPDSDCLRVCSPVACGFVFSNTRCHHRLGFLGHHLSRIATAAVMANAADMLAAARVRNTTPPQA
eukprot:5602422-Prymnesium_polylepis.1